MNYYNIQVRLSQKCESGIKENLSIAFCRRTISTKSMHRRRLISSASTARHQRLQNRMGSREN